MFPAADWVEEVDPSAPSVSSQVDSIVDRTCVALVCFFFVRV